MLSVECLILFFYYRLYYFCMNESNMLVVYGDILMARIILIFGWINIVVCIDTTVKQWLYFYYFYVVVWRVISELYLMLYYLYDY